MSDRFDGSGSAQPPGSTRVDARRAQGVQAGDHNRQLNIFTIVVNVVHELVDVAKKREPEHPPHEDRAEPPWWLRILTWLVIALRETIMTLWAPIARGLANRQPRDARHKTARAKRNRPRPRQRPSSASSAEAADQEEMPTKPWKVREVVGVFLWIGIALLALSQCQPFGAAAPAAPPNGSVQFSDRFDVGSSGWEIARAGHPPAPAAVDGTLPVKSTDGVASVASTSAVTNLDGADLIIEADIVHVEGEGQYGIYCRRFFHGGRDNYYQFAIRDDGYIGIFTSHENMPGLGTLIHWRPASALKPRQTNHIVAQCQKATNAAFDLVKLNLWINGELVASASDSSTPLLRGTVALFAEANKGQALTASFDNLVVMSPVIPTSEPR